jgi:hypothetical protein
MDQKPEEEPGMTCTAHVFLTLRFRRGPIIGHPIQLIAPKSKSAVKPSKLSGYRRGFEASDPSLSGMSLLRVLECE